MKIIELCGMTVTLEEQTLLVTVEKDKTVWSWEREYRPYMLSKEGKFLFQDARRITHEEYENGIGKGIRSIYLGFDKDGINYDYSFETLLWIEEATGNLFVEWIPLCEEGIHVEKVFWPGPMEFSEARDDWYTLITCRQGTLIPNTWKASLQKIAFDGRFETAGGFMPWFAQVKDKAGYIAICEKPWDAGYYAEHSGEYPGTKLGAWLEPSLGKMDYRRIFRYTFMDNCDYTDLCKVYRSYVNEQGKLRTLKEKEARNPSIRNLIGCSFVHKGIKTQVQPDSDFYDPQAPDKNNHLTSFAQRTEEVKEIHRAGLRKMYLHLDGWAEPGYDNQHPDYLPACKKAGGWEGMKQLCDTMHECGYLFGIHDQYRDYYLASPSFDENYACRNEDGTIPRHQRWAGGPQSYLCASQAPFYVKRNFTEIEKNGIHLDGAYLDVFTCNEGDECYNPEHKMSRKQCYEYRGACFEYLLTKGILPSSEEASDWAIPSIVFCHYAPYEFMMKRPEEAREGIYVPLFNLVYHDCMIQPWMMDRINGEDYMLYALLNGGAPYLIRDAAYPNIDGAFDSEKISLEECVKRCQIVAELHEKTADSEMIRHELLREDGSRQKTTFANGVEVIVDFREQTYQILYKDK